METSDRTRGSWELLSEDIVIQEVEALSDLDLGLIQDPQQTDKSENIDVTDNEVDEEKAAEVNNNIKKSKRLRKKMRTNKNKIPHGIKKDLNKEEKENDRKEREKIKESEEKLVCIKCNKVAFSKSDCKSARAHAIHCGEGEKRKPAKKIKNVPCALCDESFSSLVKKNKHHNRVHNALTQKCSTCGTEFKRREHLVRHIIVKHTNQEKQFKCGSCPRKFHTKYNMKTHELGCQTKLPTIIQTTVPRPMEQGLQETVSERRMGTAWENVMYITHNSRLDLVKVSETDKIKLLTSHDVPFSIKQVIVFPILHQGLP